MASVTAIWHEKYNRWQANVWINGKPKSFYSSTPGRAGKKECEAKAAKWADAGATKDAKLSQIYDEYLVHVERTSQSANYIKTESYGRIYIKPILGGKKFSTIKPRDWQRVIDRQHERGLSKKTLTNLRGTMRTFVKWAKSQEYICGDVIVDIPKTAPKGQRKVASPAAIKAVFEVDTVTKWRKQIPEWWVHAYRFIIVNGLRRGECAGIRDEDVQDGVLTIRRSINSLGEITEGKTENAQRRIGLPAIAVQIIEQQRRMKRDAGVVSPWLFCGRDGEPMDTNALYKEWHEFYGKQLGISCTLHELRHTFFSAVKSKMPLALLQSTFGHSEDTDSYGIYGHEFDDDLKQAATIVDEVFSKITRTA